MSAPRIRLPIGLSDFRALRQDGYRYVDKTALVDAVVGADAQVMLLPRERGATPIHEVAAVFDGKVTCEAGGGHDQSGTMGGSFGPGGRSRWQIASRSGRADGSG